MTINQIYAITNTAFEEATGQKGVVLEDLSNIVDVGNTVFANRSGTAFITNLLDRIGYTYVANAVFKGRFSAPLKREAWEWGSLKQKITVTLPEAEAESGWNLTDGTSYGAMLVYNKPTISVRYWNSLDTFRIPLCITEMQLKESFVSVNAYMGFVSGLFDAVKSAMDLRIDEVARKVVATMIAETLYDADNTGTYSLATLSGKTRAYNLLAEYNDLMGENLTVAECLSDREFLRYANKRMNTIIERMKDASVLFNISGKLKQTETPSVMLHTDYEKAVASYLMADTYNPEDVGMPAHTTFNYLQGTGTSYAFGDTSKIYVKLASDNTKTVTCDGIIGLAFDKNSAVVCNEKQWTRSEFNADGEFTKYLYKFNVGEHADVEENFIVFIVK